MRVVGAEEIRRAIDPAEAVAAMREAVVAQSRGDCDTPMPMHLDLASGGGGEVHIKSSYRKGGPRFALKIAGSYAKRPYGSIVLVSVESGETIAFFDDGGYLTDLRTAAVSELVARELGREDRVLGILGTGVQRGSRPSSTAPCFRSPRSTCGGGTPSGPSPARATSACGSRGCARSRPPPPPTSRPRRASS